MNSIYSKKMAEEYRIVNEGFKLTVGVDAVWGPSAPDAWVTPKEITESQTAEADTSADDAYMALAEAMKKAL